MRRSYANYTLIIFIFRFEGGGGGGVPTPGTPPLYSPLELHIVSVKDTLKDAASFKGCDDALVVGVFLRAVDLPVANSNTVWEELSPVPQKYGETSQTVSVQLSPDGKSYYFYEGSLTTDPSLITKLFNGTC